MSFEPVRGGTAPWWPPAPPPSPEPHQPAATGPTGHGRSTAVAVAGATLGGSALVLAATGFFLSSTASIIAVLASIALAGAIVGAVLGGWSLRRPLAEVGLVGLVAAGLSLPLALFDLVVAVSGRLG
ncbi:MAG: hypothetical protein J2P38_09990 [Candidatus Dormibacteraeota bacterium]|nr:hypothetical protein [Candidatus Dormibacteraeota bacterium]